jgi:hypothetical protein
MGGEIVMSEAVARIASVDGGEVVMLDLKGKAEPVTARRITIASSTDTHLRVRCGGRVIHEPLVQPTRAPTAGINQSSTRHRLT